MRRPFEEEDIEDVRIIVRAKGKHYSIAPMNEEEINRCYKVRKMCLYVCLNSHVIVSKPLEDFKDEK